MRSGDREKLDWTIRLQKCVQLLFCRPGGHVPEYRASSGECAMKLQYVGFLDIF